MDMDSHIYIHIYIYTCTHTHAYMHTHIYIYICIHIHIYIYMDTYTYTYAYICTYTYIYMYICICTYIYLSLHIYCICTSCIEREANVYADVHIICVTYISAHAWCSTTPVNACRLSAKMHMDSCMCTYATVQQLLCHGSYCELILSLARTSCRMSFTACPPAARGRARPPPSAHPPAALLPPSCRQSIASSLQKSVQIHARSWRSRRCGVPQASADHPRWCRPHPVCLWVALALGQQRLPVTEMRFRHFRAGSFNNLCSKFALRTG